MSSKSIKEYEVFIAKRGQQFQSRLADLSGTVNLAAWISFFTFDFLGDMAFGGGFETLRDGGDSSGIWSLIESSLDVLGLLSHIPWASMAVQRTPFLSHRLKSMRQFGADRAMDRLQTGASVKDLWYHLTDEAGLERTKPPIANVVADGFLAIIAGADTTATAMTCFFYLLLKHPDVYKRLQAEIDTVFPIGENPLDTSKHSNMPYLTACLNETLRIYPTVPVSGRRIVPLGGGKTIAGRFIPEGTQIYVPPYIYHRDPRYFSPSPDKFWPERWSNESAKPESFVHNATAFIPFSYGPANCVGQALAKREMMMVVSLLLQKFDMRFEEGFDASNWDYGLLDQLVFKKPALPLVLTARS
jgi:cytochrome P450